MIRSTKTSLKFANSGKRAEVSVFINEYRRLLQKFVDLIWDEGKIQGLLPKRFTDEVKGETWLSARMIQCAGKQASGIVRGTKKKNERRKFILERLKQEGDSKGAARLQAIIDENPSGKPQIKNVSAELDERFITLDFENKTSFDGWITIGSISKRGGTRQGARKKICLPFKKHSHFNEMLKSGQMKKGVRISDKTLTFMFELPDKQKDSGATIGIDIGLNQVVTPSNGLLPQFDGHGHSLKSIIEKISRRKKASQGFKQATEHRNNFLNWSINQLNLDNVREVKREDIKNLRRGKNTSRFLSHWTYAAIFGKLDSYCESQGVLVTKVNPAYTSQTCPRCSTLGKRKGEYFSCSCGYANNADLNAAVNLSGEPIVPRENDFL